MSHVFGLYTSNFLSSLMLKWNHQYIAHSDFLDEKFLVCSIHFPGKWKMFDTPCKFLKNYKKEHQKCSLDVSTKERKRISFNECFQPMSTIFITPHINRNENMESIDISSIIEHNNMFKWWIRNFQLSFTNFLSTSHDCILGE